MISLQKHNSSYLTKNSMIQSDDEVLEPESPDEE